jgi:hypothetical protein
MAIPIATNGDFVKTFAPKFAYFLAAIFLLAGCAGHVRQVTVAILGVPPSGFVAPNQTITLQGIVNHDRTMDGVTWSVTGAGTFTSTTTSLTYTAPPNVPENPLVTVTATSISKPTASAVATFTIATAALSVQITNPITTITVGGANATLNATVTNDVNNQGVSWDLFTAGTTTECAPTCGTIVSSTSTSVVYMPPVTVPSPNQASLVATSIADNTQSATDTFTIQSSSGNLGLFSGPYAMELGGFDGSGNALTLAGSVTSDGNGNIISSEFDVNDNFGVSNVTTLIGTYTLDSNLRGLITLTQPLPGFGETPTFAFTLDNATNTGVIISADDGGEAVSGLLAHQSAAAQNSMPDGSFIFRASSDASNNREGEVGQITISSGPTYTGFIDQDDIVNGVVTTDAAINGNISSTDVNGRGQFTLTGGAGGQTSYFYYLVGTNEFFLVEANPDATYMNVGVARFQNLTTFNANSANGTGAFGVIGGDNDGGDDNFVSSSVAIGQLIISGGNTASVVCDLNDQGDASQCNGGVGAAVKKAAGSIKPNAVASPIPGTVTFDPTSGRGTITLPNGYDDGLVNSLVFYIEQPGAGVLLDTTPFVEGIDGLPQALVGDWIPQTSTSDVVGQVQGLGLIAESEENAAIEGELTIQGSGQTTGLFDAAVGGNQPILDASVSGNISESDGNGRSTATLISDVFGETGDFAIYEVSPSQFFFIGIDDDDSPLGIFTPQTLGQEADAKKPAPAATGVTSTKTKAARKAVKHHGHPRPSALPITKLPAR